MAPSSRLLPQIDPSHSIASSVSTLKAHAFNRAPTPEPSTTPTKGDRPRSSSFSVSLPGQRRDSDAASFFSRAGKMTPHRSSSAREADQQPPSPLMTSPSAQSLASMSTSTLSSRAPPNLYDSGQMKAAIERFEGAHRGDGKSELGSVGAVGFGGDDAWQTVTVKVLPLWNSEPLNGYIEDLNDIVERHIKRIVDRSPTHAIAYLTEHFQEMLATGMLTLGAKLSYLGDDQFLPRLDEIWVSFFNRILPYLEAIFLPFETSSELQNLHAAYSRSSDVPILEPIPVRRLALIAFRDQILLPTSTRLISLFAYVASLLQPAGRDSRRASLASTVSSGHTPNASTYKHAAVNEAMMGSTPRRLQMLGLIASVHTDDDSQEEVELMLRALRGDIDIADLQRTASPVDISSEEDEQELGAKRHRDAMYLPERVYR